ncbi:hypothetical protein, partial [Achromobacter sp. GbtcB20]|uniref:hypothetical protein n=1 Tax=Achromobacter sp. GbtcB20 TaxID=2824765 RepID=UPI001C2FDFAE
MHDPATPPAPWWTARPALVRFIGDLVASELAALRHDPMLQARTWNQTLALEHDPGLDFKG